jgi:cell division protein FtsL
MFKWLQKSKKAQFQITVREYRLVLMAVAGLMIAAMAFVWSNTRLVGLAYEYQILDKTYRNLLRKNNLLRVERESLQSLGRVQLLAKNKIGLREPESGQIVTIFLKK